MTLWGQTWDRSARSSTESGFWFLVIDARLRIQVRTRYRKWVNHDATPGERFRWKRDAESKHVYTPGAFFSGASIVRSRLRRFTTINRARTYISDAKRENWIRIQRENEQKVVFEFEIECEIVRMVRSYKSQIYAVLTPRRTLSVLFVAKCGCRGTREIFVYRTHFNAIERLSPGSTLDWL